MVQTGPKNENRMLILSLTVIGLICNGVLSNMLGYTPVFLSAPELYGVARFSYLLAGAFVGLAAFARCRRFKDISVKRWTAAMGAISFAGTALLSGHGLGILNQEVVFAGFVMAGAGNVWNLLMAYCSLKRETSLSASAACICISSAAAAPLFQAVRLCMGLDVQIAVALVFCVGAALSLFLSFSLNQSKDDGKAGQMENRLPSDADKRFAAVGFIKGYPRVSVFLLISIIAIVANYGVGNNGVWGEKRELFHAGDISLLQASLVSSVIFLIGAGVFRIVFRKRNEKAQLNILLLVLTTGFFLRVAVELINASSEIELIFSSILSTCNTSICQIVVVYCLRLVPYSAFLLGGIREAMVNGVALIWLTLFEDPGVTESILALSAAYVIMIIVTFGIEKNHAIRQTSSLNAIESEEDNEASNSRFDISSACERLSAEKGLTARETEILGYLALGRSLPYISSELYISNGTARTHARNIYKKLNVHSRQELLDALYRMT